MDLNVQSNIDIRKTCRTCLRVLKTRKELLSIFDLDQTLPNQKIKFSQMLVAVSNQHVLEHDNLPKRICIICLQQIRSSYFFKTQAENSYKILVNQIKKCNDAVAIKQEQPVQVNSFEQNMDIDSLPLTQINNEDMLVEVEPPKLNAVVNENEDSTGDSIIVYDPEFTDDDDTEELIDSNNDASTFDMLNGNSPATDEENAAEYEIAVERQTAESQLKEFKDLECAICNKQMLSAVALRRHKAARHSANLCKYCRRRFGNQVQLRMHVRFKHANKYNEFRLNGQVNAVVQIEPLPELLSCDNCEAKFCDKESLYRHHSHCDGKCVECSLIIPHKDFYFQHLATEHNVVIDKNAYLECPFGCSNKFASSKVLELHVQKNHPENEKESIADTLSDTEDETNSNDSFLTCSICSSNFWSQRGLTHHMRTVHGFGTPKAEPNKVTLTKNAPKYTREEFIDRFMVRKSSDSFRCTACKTDINRKSLAVHLKGRHASIQPYRCELCPEGFFRSDYRQRHMRYQHRDKYNCVQCNQQFDRIYKYDAHMSLHGIPAKNFKPPEGLDQFDLITTNVKFIEDQATYDFSNQGPQRRESTASNTNNGSVYEIPLSKDEFTKKHFKFYGDSDVRCLLCQQNLKIGSVISHLLWKHAVKKPMKCAFCNERWVKAAARLAHMARYHPSKYRCSRCYVQFSKHLEWSNHMSEVHKEEIKTTPAHGEEKDLTLSEIRFVPRPNDEEEIEEEESELGSQASSTETGFACQYCSRRCTSSKNLKLHVSHKHRDILNEKYSERINDESFAEPMKFDDFQKKFVEHIDHLTIKCLACDEILRKKIFENHLKALHATTGAYKCAVCPVDFFRKEHRMQHMSQAHRGMFFCGACNIQYYRNSRYAEHMKQMHEIEVDSLDEYEVDLKLNELKFTTGKPEASVQNNDETDIEVDEDEGESSTNNIMPEGGFQRAEFMKRYIKIINKESRRCIACERTMLKRSMYSHLMTTHATIQPFKCPFCDLRLGRAPERMRHIETFHPNEYKCQECGVQFHKHALFADHMLEEHNINSTTEKAEGEEEDLESSEIKYVPVLQSEENSLYQDDEGSTADGYSGTNNDASTLGDDMFLKPKIKEEPSSSGAIMHSIFGTDEPFPTDKTISGYEYNEFKAKFIRSYDNDNFRCIPCGRLIIKTSICAHLRLWHALTMSYNCELCPVGFQRSDYRQRHMKMSHVNDFNCNLCDIQFYRSVLYKQHMLLNHQIKVNIPELKTKDEIDPPLESLKFIENVPDSIRQRSLPKKSKKPAEQILPMDPKKSGMTFNEFSQNFIKDSGVSIVCKVCNVSLSKFTLKKHVRLFHATTKSFFCELCSEGFRKAEERTQHMAASHPGHFKCSSCKVQFYISSSFVEHMQIIHNESVSLQPLKKLNEIDVPIERLRFTKEITEDTSAEKNASLVQTKDLVKPSESKDGWYTREQFYRTFFKDVMSNGERKTKCSACFKSFSSQNKVFHVYSNHSKEKPIKCELCDTKFFFISKRVSHMATHHPNDYKCSNCKVQFDRAHLYIAHMQTKHGVVVENVPIFADDEVEIPPDKMRYTKEITSVYILAQRRRNSIDSLPRDTSFSSNSETSMIMEPMKCGGCQSSFDSARALRTHLRNQANGCSSTVANEIEKLKEEKVVELNFECDQCEKKFSSQVALSAHKNFKHKEAKKVETVKKSERTKFDAHCDICDFTSPRRDYVENHVRQMHPKEFHCKICSKTMSNYFFYMYHMQESHPRSPEPQKCVHKCNECRKCFMFETNLESHMIKHDAYYELENCCEFCGLVYHSAEDFEIHRQNRFHKAIQSFVDNLLKNGPLIIKKEPKETQEEDKRDPFENMLKMIEEPAKKRIKIASADDAISKGTSSTPTVIAPSDEDKLDYLKYITQVNGLYKCGICGKTKQLRKGMLHHLKQHDEVPSYDCHLCPEKFVFKKKYEKHLECHANNENFGKDLIDVDEHPKFQEGAKADTIKCDICQITFKLKIMLNRHEQQWHSDDNTEKNRPMSEQKSRKEESNQDLPLSKLLSCKHCLETFIHPFELEHHVIEKHDLVDESKRDEKKTEDVAEKIESFACDKCKFVFKELKFLENHQKFFCVFGQARSEQVINEQ